MRIVAWLRKVWRGNACLACAGRGQTWGFSPFSLYAITRDQNDSSFAVTRQPQWVGCSRCRSTGKEPEEPANVDAVWAGVYERLRGADK